jgi:hypothetical protein
MWSSGKAIRRTITTWWVLKSFPTKKNNPMHIFIIFL